MNLEKQINEIYNEIYNEIKKNYNKINKKTIKIIKNDMKENIEIFYPEFFISDNFLDIYLDNYILKNRIKLNNNNERDIYFRNICNFIKIPKKYINFWNQYKKLESLPQPEQKSPEWFAMRNNFITASAGAQALEENKYDKRVNLLKQKIGIGEPFKENRHVHHGKKFEKIAILIYEHINNVYVGEFGLVPHISEPQISYLGASPDGICTCTTLDKKFSNMVGRMLEIKCTTTRVINIKGKEDGEICPHYYWVQVQLQLECCDLEDCDFWQCKLVDYEDKEEWLDELENRAKNTRQQEIKIEIDERFESGCIIEFIPINKEIPLDEKIEFYGQYIYPTTLEMSIKEKIEWGDYMEKNWEKHYPELKKEYKFNKIRYWHLEKSHCYLIKRDREWFKDKQDKLKEFWDDVIYYRNNEEAKMKLKEETSKPEKKYKKIEIHDMNINLFDSDSD
jgi:putative phage-type endonuclease